MKPFTHLVLSLGLLTALAPSAFAQSYVLGTGPGKGCYEKALFGNNGSQEAIEICNTALAGALSRTNRGSTHNNRAILLMRKGDLEAAKSDYEQAIKLRPELIEIQINYAAVLMRLNDSDAALDALNMAIDSEIPTKRAFVFYNRSIIHEDRQNFTQAYKDLKSALDINPDWPLALNALERFKSTSKKQVNR